MERPSVSYALVTHQVTIFQKVFRTNLGESGSKRLNLERADKIVKNRNEGERNELLKNINARKRLLSKWDLIPPSKLKRWRGKRKSSKSLFRRKRRRSRDRHFQSKRQIIQIVGEKELKTNMPTRLRRNTRTEREASELHEELLSLKSTLESNIRMILVRWCARSAKRKCRSKNEMVSITLRR